MLDAIQRMRRERRFAMLLFAACAVVALFVHWFSTVPDVHAPQTVPAPTETVE